MSRLWLRPAPQQNSNHESSMLGPAHGTGNAAPAPHSPQQRSSSHGRRFVQIGATRADRYTREVSACTRCGEENATSANFCRNCGTALHVGSRPESRRTVTVVFSDISGFTSLGENADPEAVRARVDRYFADARRIIEHHGGVVEKFIGDAVMAVFGLPTVHEDDAIRAMRAALEVRDGARTQDFEVHTGIATGSVIARLRRRARRS